MRSLRRLSRNAPVNALAEARLLVGMPFTTQLCLSRGGNSFASMPESDQAWPSMVVALCNIRSEQAAPPVAAWQLEATCAAPAHWARRRCRELVFCISRFEHFDTRCASEESTRFDQSDVFVSAYRSKCKGP